MSVSIAEQETTINIMRDKDCAEIYTSDSTMRTAKKPPAIHNELDQSQVLKGRKWLKS